MKLTIIKPELDEIEDAEEIEIDGQPSLELLQGYVNGYIELVYIGEEKEMYINEEGKLNGLAFNPLASQLFWEQHPHLQGHDFIVGTAVITSERCI